MSKSMNRRALLRGMATGAGVIALARLPVAGAENPRLDPDSEQAKALHYVHDAADAADHAQYEEGEICANCSLWTGGDADWGGCAIFPGKDVAAAGWCAAWAPKS